MYSACFSTKMLVAKLAQMGNFCLAKSDAMWPMAQIATSSASVGTNNMNCLKNGDNADVIYIYIDFAKALNKVDFMVTLRKLNSLGISGKVGRWTHSFSQTEHSKSLSTM